MARKHIHVHFHRDAFKESEHPRDKEGMFAESGSGNAPWRDQPVTKESVHAMLSEMHRTGTPAERAALNQLKEIKIGVHPSFGGHEAAAINPTTGVLHVNPKSQYSAIIVEGKRTDTSHETLNSQTLGLIKHELGHLTWEQMKQTPAGKAFAQEVKKDIAAGKSISAYQATMFQRYKAGQADFDRVLHESYAEWMRFGLSNNRGAESQHKAASAVAEAHVKGLSSPAPVAPATQSTAAKKPVPPAPAAPPKAAASKGAFKPGDLVHQKGGTYPRKVLSYEGNEMFRVEGMGVVHASKLVKAKS